MAKRGQPLSFRGICYKPSSVTNKRWPLVIYLRRQSLAASSNLPPDIGRATLNCRYTWSCNPRDVLTEEYCYPRGGLLPRLLTLTLAGGYFLLRYYTLTSIKPLTCVVLYVARTFLPHPKVAATRRICGRKDIKKKEKVQKCVDADFCCMSVQLERKS